MLVTTWPFQMKIRRGDRSFGFEIVDCGQFCMSMNTDGDTRRYARERGECALEDYMQLEANQMGVPWNTTIWNWSE